MTFNISQYGIGDPNKYSNALGLAVNPINGNIFLTTLSYGGADNLWEFKSDGTLLSSVRADVNTGPFSDIKGIVMARDGSLLTQFAKDLGSNAYENWIISINRSGSDIKYLFKNSYNYGGGGISYNPVNNNILLQSFTDKKIFEVRLNGELINSFDVNYSFNDIVFDPVSGKIFGLYDNSKTLVTYEYLGKGYREKAIYDLTSIGINEHVLVIDINNTNLYFYIQENNKRVVEFSLNDLRRVP